MGSCHCEFLLHLEIEFFPFNKYVFSFSISVFVGMSLITQVKVVLLSGGWGSVLFSSNVFILADGPKSDSLKFFVKFSLMCLSWKCILIPVCRSIGKVILRLMLGNLEFVKLWNAIGFKRSGFSFRINPTYFLSDKSWDWFSERPSCTGVWVVFWLSVCCNVFVLVLVS